LVRIDCLVNAAGIGVRRIALIQVSSEPQFFDDLFGFIGSNVDPATPLGPTGWFGLSLLKNPDGERLYFFLGHHTAGTVTEKISTACGVQCSRRTFRIELGSGMISITGNRRSPCPNDLTS
jgi:hypothetical protein